MALFRKESDEKIDTRKMTITTMVGKDTTVEGTISTKSSIRIDGTVIGGINCAGIVIISMGALVKGNIIAENVIVAGIVEGNTKADDKVNVEPTGEIYGDITSNSLLIDEKSIFQGNCFINRGKEKKGNVVDELIFEKREPVKADEKSRTVNSGNPPKAAPQNKAKVQMQKPVMPAEPAKAVSKPAEPAKAVSKPAEPVKAVSKPAEPVKAVSKPAEPVKAVSMPSEPAKAVSKPAEPVKAVSKPAEPVKAVSKPAEPAKTAVKPELKPMPKLDRQQVVNEQVKPQVREDIVINRGTSSEVRK